MLFLAVVTLIASLLTARAVQAPHQLRGHGLGDYVEVACASLGAFVFTGLIAYEFVDLLPILSIFLIVSAVTAHFSERLTARGIVWTAAQATILLVSPVWAYLFVTELNLPAWLEVVTLVGTALAFLAAGALALANFAREAILTHERWVLPTSAPMRASKNFRPKVSLHLCCYAEPPEIVKETMDRLADLDYDNFEVLVCDNNTADERLWRPLEAHSATLNARMGREVFRFFHVAPLKGAKAGALNYCLEQMDQSAEIVGVIDADYLSRKDFLARLVPLFEDPELGYVQTPHDYRDYQHSEYLTSCYWEYMPVNRVDYAGISEYGGAFTIGTMCLLRTEALKKAGGWADWCLTEDSEVSVRLRAVGYRGLYFVETFGRGLIPETFDDYKKQRFRWTAGPVQQLRRHWRLFMPSPWAPRMPGWTKLLEIARCSTPLARLAGIVTLVFSLSAMAVAAASGTVEQIDVPDVSWLVLLMGAAVWCVRTVHRYHLAGCYSVSNMIRGEIARASLSYVILQGGVAGLSSRPLAWRRTPKFAINESEPSPFETTRSETMAGSICLGVAALVLAGSPMWGFEFALLVSMGLGTLAAQFFCAPLLAAMAIRHQRQIARQTQISEKDALRLAELSAIPTSAG